MVHLEYVRGVKRGARGRQYGGGVPLSVELARSAVTVDPGSVLWVDAHLQNNGPDRCDLSLEIGRARDCVRADLDGGKQVRADGAFYQLGRKVPVPR